MIWHGALARFSLTAHLEVFNNYYIIIIIAALQHSGKDAAIPSTLHPNIIWMVIFSPACLQASAILGKTE